MFILHFAATEVSWALPATELTRGNRSLPNPLCPCWQTPKNTCQHAKLSPKFSQKWREKQKWRRGKGGIYLLESGKISTVRSLLSSSSALGRYLFQRCYPKAFVSQFWVQASSLSLDDSFLQKTHPILVEGQSRDVRGRKGMGETEQGRQVKGQGQGAGTLCFTPTLPIWKDRKVGFFYFFF